MSRALLLLKLQSCTSHTRKAQQSHFLLRGQVCSTCVWQEGSETFQYYEKIVVVTARHYKQPRQFIT